MRKLLLISFFVLVFLSSCATSLVVGVWETETVIPTEWLDFEKYESAKTEESV